MLKNFLLKMLVIVWYDCSWLITTKKMQLICHKYKLITLKHRHWTGPIPVGKW